jgi:hypothetical protein
MPPGLKESDPVLSRDTGYSLSVRMGLPFLRNLLMVFEALNQKKEQEKENDLFSM